MSVKSFIGLALRHSIMTFSIMALSLTTFSKMTLFTKYVMLKPLDNDSSLFHRTVSDEELKSFYNVDPCSGAGLTGPAATPSGTYPSRTTKCSITSPTNLDWATER